MEKNGHSDVMFSVRSIKITFDINRTRTKATKKLKMITKKIIADQLLAYLQHRTSLPGLVDWAEESLLHADYKDDSSHTIRNILAQLGSADVKAFGLEWKDCERIMEKLGFKLEVKALEVA